MEYVGSNLQDHNAGSVVIEHYEQREHVLIAPEMYIGSPKPIQREEYSYNPSNNSISHVTVTLPPAVVHLFMEALANAIDNVTRSRRSGVDPGVVIITMNENTVSIYNEGVPLPITRDESGKWKPTMAFGVMNTSSNFSGDRNVIGRNGVGIKANNIWSARFTAEVVDKPRGLSFAQMWTNNMSECSEAIVNSISSDRSWVRITYQLDFPRLGLQGYPAEAFGLFMYHCINASYTCRVPVHFNSHIFNYTDIESYALLYFGGQKKPRSISHRIYSGESQGGKKKGKKGEKGEFPTIELLALDTPHSAITISFVNGMMTPDGGVHVDETMRSVTKGIVRAINGDPPTKDEKKKNEGTVAKKEKEVKKKEGPRLTIRDVRNHVSIFVSVQVTNPIWHSQMKTALKGPSIKIELEPGLLRKVEEWDLVETLKATLRSKKALLASAGGGAKRRFLGEIKGMDANEAGGARSSECTLIIIEGDSASNYAVVMISQIQNGRDWIGTLPIRGKLRNAIKADDEQMNSNKEVCEIKKMFGLQDYMDYSVPENRSTLRYGRLMLMMDADVDGHHIEALILAFIDKYFPQLITLGMVVEYRTCLLRLKKGQQKLKFYFEHDYLRWKAENNDWKEWKHKWYKGLGSSSEADVIEDFSDPKIVTFLRDPLASESIQLAFNSKRTDDRKRWIHNYVPPPPALSVPNTISVSDYINHVLITYSRASIRRHLPLLEDGLIPSRRKVIWATFDKWGFKPKQPSGYKIGLLAARTIEKTHYHHGDSLPNVIVAMAQDFVGANNLHYFTQESMLGTREYGGKDAAKPRYTDTKPNWWIPLVFHPEDVELLARLEDEGEDIEPAFFLPILPLHLINGASQTATAYSTFIPNHHPLHVLEWLMVRMGASQEQTSPVLRPWYRGFTGIIEVIDRKKIPPSELPPDSVPSNLPQHLPLNEDGDVEERDILMNSEAAQIPLDEEGDVIEEAKQGEQGQSANKNGELDHNLITYRVREHHWSMVTKGKYFIRDDGTVVVSELPIGVWTASYRNWLIRMQVAKRITGYKDLSTHKRVWFEIDGFKVRVKKPTPPPKPKNKRICELPSLSQPSQPQPEGGDAAGAESTPGNGSEVTSQATVAATGIVNQSGTNGTSSSDTNTSNSSGGEGSTNAKNKKEEIEVPICELNKVQYHDLHRQLRLIKSYGLNDMILIDNQCRPTRYDTVELVMEAYFQWRLPLYELRRQHLMRRERSKVEHLTNKMEFLKAVLERRLLLTREDGKPRRTADIHREMDALGLQRVHLSKTVIENVTQEKVDELSAEILELTSRLRQLESSTAASLWMNDLSIFKQQYLIHYPNDLQPQSEIHEITVPVTTKRTRRTKKK